MTAIPVDIEPDKKRYLLEMMSIGLLDRDGENISPNSYTQKPVGLNPGFGSSTFGVCITELVNGIVNVLHAEEYARPDFNQMI